MATLPIVNKKTNTDFEREELKEMLPLYELIRDVLGGSTKVKYRKAKYLPIPNAEAGKESDARYAGYIMRAVFYSVARRTLEGFIGEIFDKDPTITIPDAMKLIIEDATGEGVGIIQLAKKDCRKVLGYGRSGILVDYPTMKEGASQADIIAGIIRPVLISYRPEDVINWRHKKVGAKKQLSLVVIRETYDIEDDGFTVTKGKQWRVLRLNAANQYTVEFYREKSGTQILDIEGNAIATAIVPLDAAGKAFDEIPFKFIGAHDNDADVDYPPAYDLCDLNLAHYRNSADYEEATFMVGQPTPVVTGLTEQWADKYFKDGIGLGSRAAITLPVGGSAELLQAAETNMAKDAMDQKERQMVALGAKLVEQATVQRTATEAGLETASEKSTLSNIVDNVSVAYEWALYFCARFMGVPADGEGKIVFRLNKEFSISFSTPEARKEAIEAWVAGAISRTEMRMALRNGGLARQPDDVAFKEIKTDEDNGDGPVDPNADPNADPNEDDPNKDDPNGTTSATE